MARSTPRTLILVFGYLASGGCSTGVAPDDHFTCAALIGAEGELAFQGKATADAADRQNGQVALMSHFTAWAVPTGLPEREAFNQVKGERDRLIAVLTPAEIATRAHACIDAV